MFEVGHSRTTRMQARDADLQPLPHDLDLTTSERPDFSEPDDHPVRIGFHRVDPVTVSNPPAKRLSLGTGLTRRARLLLMALGLGLGLGAAEQAGRFAKTSAEFERSARLLGFGIDQVTLAGHHFSFDRDIFDALDLANVRSFAALDTAAVKSRIERLPWIDTAELTRVYPGRLDIRVTERKPFALWSRADRLYLIDQTGRVLSAVTDASLPDLPRFAGEGAATEAAGLLEAVARYPDLKRRLELAERVSERRWTLKLSDATTLVLPADGEVGALEQVARDPVLARLVADGHATIDFRGPGRAAVRREQRLADTQKQGS